MIVGIHRLCVRWPREPLCVSWRDSSRSLSVCSRRANGDSWHTVHELRLYGPLLGIVLLVSTPSERIPSPTAGTSGTLYSYGPALPPSVRSVVSRGRLRRLPLGHVRPSGWRCTSDRYTHWHRPRFRSRRASLAVAGLTLVGVQRRPAGTRLFPPMATRTHDGEWPGPSFFATCFDQIHSCGSHWPSVPFTDPPVRRELERSAPDTLDATVTDVVLSPSRRASEARHWLM